MRYKYDVVIIGVGSAGMIAGEVAAKMGVNAALVERHRVGGDCLWTGCVPSKALLASAKAAHTMRHADKYGLAPIEIEPDSAPVWQRVREIQRDIANTDDNPDKYGGLGVDLLWGEASFESEHRIRVGERVLTSQYALVCTGSRPAAPTLSGLAEIGYLTSENVFELERVPRSLIIIGGGPIGVEMAQAMSRLGVKTAALQRADRILERDEPALTEILLEELRDEGVDVQLGAELASAGREGAEKVVRGRVGGEEKQWRAEEVLVAAGRTPNMRAEGATKGRMIAVTDSKFKILGAHILAPSAGEMISQFTLAVNKEMRLTPDFGNLVQVYPTFSTSVSQLAAEATYGQLQKPFLQALRRINGLFSRS